MKKALILLCAAVVIFSYAPCILAQTGAEQGTSTMFNFSNYKLRNPNVESENTVYSGNLMKMVNYREQGYENTAVEKMGDGVLNATTAWTDIPKEMSRTAQNDNFFMGMTLGFGKGIAYGVSRGISGAYQVATCGLPPYDETVMRPEYKSDNPQKELKITVFSW
jgi:putative exosortase-associated protein (TIGR04073 family)